MKKLIPFYSIILFFLLHGAAFAREEFLIEVWAPSNALNPTLYSPIGTGFWITDEGHALTAAHVVLGDRDDGRTILARAASSTALELRQIDRTDRLRIQDLISEGKLFELNVLECDLEIDICLLQAQDFQPELQNVEIGGYFDEQDRLELWGVEVSSTNVANFNRFYTNLRRIDSGLIETSEPMRQGYSGGPAFNGESLVGISLRRNDTIASGTVLPIERVGGLLAAQEIRLRGDQFWTVEARISALEREVGSLLSEVEQSRNALKRLQAELFFDVGIRYDPLREGFGVSRKLYIDYGHRFRGQFSPQRISVTIVPIILSIEEERPEANFIAFQDWRVVDSFSGRELSSPLVIDDVMDRVEDRFTVWMEETKEFVLTQAGNDPEKAANWGLSEEHLSWENLPLPEFKDIRALRVEVKAWFPELGEISAGNYVREIHRIPM
ncbi:S1 family peptidase [Roseobacter sp. A03A-229]